MKPAWITASLLAALVAVATAPLAHEPAQDPTVRARMAGMTRLADHIEVLGHMARGETPFDADAANEALDRISGQANRIIDLFEAPATDPQSAARAEVWDNFANFSSRAMDLELLSAGLAGTIEDRTSLIDALRRVGARCSGCHEQYRIPRD